MFAPSNIPSLDGTIITRRCQLKVWELGENSSRTRSSSVRAYQDTFSAARVAVNILNCHNRAAMMIESSSEAIGDRMRAYHREK
jgi:hypothetical protein